MSETAGNKEVENTEVLARRTCFHVGGKYEAVDKTSPGASTVYTGHAHVEKLVPQTPNPKMLPIIFIAGAGQKSTVFLNRPDGRPGWASYVLSHGHTVYLFDPPQSSHASPSQIASWGTRSVDFVESAFTAPEKFPKASTSHSQAYLHSQWPGDGIRGDPVFDHFFAAQVPFQKSSRSLDVLVRDALNALLDQLGPSILITHSQAGPYGWVAGDTRPDLVKAIIAIEPEGPPFALSLSDGNETNGSGIARLPLQFDPPLGDNAGLETQVIQPSEEFKGVRTNATLLKAARMLVNLSKVFVVFITGEASEHARSDWATVEFLRRGGVEVDWLDLGIKGEKGNGHFLFLEKNSDDIATLASESLKAFFHPKTNGTTEEVENEPGKD